MNHRKLLIGMIAFFFVFWFIVPLIVPGAGFLVRAATLPFRQLGIFVHEMGHGLFTVLSGGSFYWFQMEIMKGGVAITSGGFRFLTLLGGLLAPSLFGALLLRYSVRTKNTKPVFWLLMGFFLVGIYYMVKPLFLSRGAYPFLDRWHIFYLISLIVPATALVLTYKIRVFSETVQRGYLQVLGILMCWSGYSDTRYVFQYEQLSNGLFSDARVFASLFWGTPETVPYGLFFAAACFISVLNFGLMAWGVHGALMAKSPSGKSPLSAKAASENPGGTASADDWIS